MYHVNMNISLMIVNVTRIKSGILINVGVSAKIFKKIMRAKEIMFGILQHAVLKMMNILQVLLMIQQLHVMKL